MKKPTTQWTPWHKVVRLREDVRTGELSLAVFAADLYDVAMKRARPVYRDPKEFFALTYPTFNLRELAKDVVTRLAGKNDKAIRQLELTYGGGKTHTLITLFHLVNDASKLPDIPAVQEFIEHIGFKPPKARVGVLAFDKLDAEKGMEVLDPDGKARWLKHPWSVLAYQLAGSAGLKLLHASGKDEERESAPAENLLVELLAKPQAEKLSTLILIDEVLMYAREKVGLDSSWRAKLTNFFQYLTQAATKVDRCAVVASLLATDPAKSDTLGKEITQELHAIFRREREEGVQPVLKEDVAEVLRRRFFEPNSIRDREAFRPHVVAALKGVCDLDELTKKEGKAAEERFLKSFPFHPDLTEVFYGKWTSLEGFQRTRGVLRTFALALRDAEKWDDCPVAGSNVFIGAPMRQGLAEAARELTNVAATEEYEGRKQEWTAILEGELGKAREIQAESPALKFREIEQAVFGTFLHSQPIGQKALTRELMVLLGHTRPDKIELEKALRRWTETSWFLDEGAVQDVDSATDGRRSLPKAWRLGSKPNLRQMHHDACTRVSPELIESKLLDEIQKNRRLSEGAGAAGAKAHVLPDRPKDIEDDGEFHFAVLGPKAASDSGKPSAEARRFIEETTSADRPRVYKNAVVLAVPSREGLDLARQRIREYMGWEEVRAQLKDQEIDPVRAETLSINVDASRKRIAEAIGQAFNVVVTLSDKNEVQAFKIPAADEPLFTRIKANPAARIQETAVSADALLPEGPYNLWQGGETSRRVKDLVGAFAQFPHLPKMLNRRAIVETLLAGCRAGQFVLRVTRPDRSTRTYWREDPAEADIKEPSLEVVLPEAAALSELSPALLDHGRLPGLWSSSTLTLADLAAFFSGKKTIKVQRDGYEEPVAIPKAEAAVLHAAIGEAVRSGRLWLTSGAASLLAEPVPDGLLGAESILQAPPAPIPPSDLLEATLPDAWKSKVAVANSIAAELSKKAGKNLPWSAVRAAIDGAVRSRMMEPTSDSAPWPCDFASAHSVRFQPAASAPPPPPPPPRKGVLVAKAELRVSEIQNLADQLEAIRRVVAGADIKFTVEIAVDLKGKPASDFEGKLNEALAEVSSNLRVTN